jgi:hypothetical protein
LRKPDERDEEGFYKYNDERQTYIVRKILLTLKIVKDLQ